MILRLRTGLILLAVISALILTETPVWGGADRYFGVVVKVDTSNSYVIVMDPRRGSRFRFSVTGRTVVQEGEEVKSIMMLKTGDSVIVEYTLLEESYMAHRILIQSDLK